MHNRSVFIRRQVCDNRRFVRVLRSVTAVDNLLNLIAILPVVVRGNQSPVAIAQFQCWISQKIWNAKVAELWANGAQNHPLCLISVYHETANHYVIASLYKAAGTDVAQIRRRAVELNPIEIRSPATDDWIEELKGVASGVQNDGRLY